MREDIETIFDEVIDDLDLDDEQLELAHTIRARLLRKLELFDW